MSTAAKVGAFFLVVLAITGLLIWKIEDLRLGRGAPRKITVQFQNVAGLDEKTAVRVAGVSVGKVSKIRLVEGKALGLDEKWAYNAVKAVGNYGQIFERNVGAQSPLKLDRGLNDLWTRGGLIYAIPIR